MGLEMLFNSRTTLLSGSCIRTVNTLIHRRGECIVLGEPSVKVIRTGGGANVNR